MPPNTLITVFISLFVIIPTVTSCPRKEDLAPCHCEWPNNEGSAYITCSGLDNEQDLINAASSLKGKRYIYSFTIDNSNFNFIPHDTFKGVQIVELEIRDSNLMGLTDTDEAFVGLEEHLEIFMMKDCTFMNEWDWSILKNLKKLMRLESVGGDLETIGAELRESNITSVEDVAFSKNKISFVYDHAFVTFKNIRFLYLDDNEIKEVKRSMFPNPALGLMHFDITHNLIEELPEDMFTNMPILESLSIGYNKILVMNEKTFSPVWEQLELFHVLGNELRCDCRMFWMLEKKFPQSMRGVCAKPQEVRGKSLASLTSKDLWCYI